MICRGLARYGYRVLEAGHPSAAVAIADKTPRIDLLVTDVVMPEMSGRNLADAFRERFPSGRVLYMSAYSAAHGGDDANTPSAHEFLQKPFSIQRLVRRVEENLARDLEPDISDADAESGR